MKEKYLSVPDKGWLVLLVWIAVVLSAASLIVSISSFFIGSSSKIAYVRSNELIQNYVGMKEADQKMKEKVQEWQANIDTLQHDFDQSLNMYNQEYKSYSKEEHSDRQQFLRRQEENLEQYKQAVETKVQEEERQMTQGVLNQINSFVAEYGKKHGYEVILGTTSAGSLLYGTDAIDITHELIAELNNAYRRKP